jgi:hypothetical protein
LAARAVSWPDLRKQAPLSRNVFPALAVTAAYGALLAFAFVPHSGCSWVRHVRECCAIADDVTIISD